MMVRRKTCPTSTSMNEGGKTSRSPSQPPLSMDKRMNLQDFMICKKFARTLRRRVQERRLGRPASEGTSKRVELARQLEPTYQVEPQRRPLYQQCSSVIEQYLSERLQSSVYHDEDCKKLSRSIADGVKDLLLADGWPQRYKCVVYINLGQKMGQGVRVSSRCVWDPSSDNFITCSFENASLFCVVTVFAVYFE